MLDITEMSDALVKVRQGMRDGVTKDYGTSYLLVDMPMSIGAKTGSAQVSNNTKINALFVGYAAQNQDSPPEVAILILVEDAKEGSLNTVPIARDVLRWYYENRIQDSEETD